MCVYTYIGIKEIIVWSLSKPKREPLPKYYHITHFNIFSFFLGIKEIIVWSLSKPKREPLPTLSEDAAEHAKKS